MKTNNKKNSLISNGLKKVYLILFCVLIIFTLSACTKPNTTSSIQNTVNTTNQTDISSHNNVSDCWTIINGTTYNITSYIASNQHSAGNNVILPICGKDGTNLFNSIPKHSKIGNLLDQYKVQ